MNKEDVLARLERMGASPKRSLGQNFLVSENVIGKIIGAVEKTKPEHLLEIGPGLGSLTDHLLQLEMQKFVLIELDKTFAEHWRQKDLPVLEQDALQVDWENFSEVKDGSVLVSNLPYQISASLVMELSSLERPLFRSMILMFQKEVAERITAAPKTKDYGVLSVLAQNRWKIKKVVDAAPACFHPRPQVASRVLQFDGDEQGFGSRGFLKFVKSAFQNRRKLLMKSLKGLDASFDWTNSLESLNKIPTARAEELSPLEWRRLYLDFKSKA